MAYTLNEIRTTLVTALDTVDGLNVYAYPPKAAVPPFAFVVPDSVNYDATYARGLDNSTWSLYVGSGAQMPEDQADDFDSWVDGAAFKAVLEAIPDFALRVTTAEFTTLGLAASDYAAVKFTLDITA